MNSCFKAWTNKKKEHKKIKAYRKSNYRERTVDTCVLILDLKSLRSLVKEKHSTDRKFQSLAVQEKKLLT